MIHWKCHPGCVECRWQLVSHIALRMQTELEAQRVIEAHDDGVFFEQKSDGSVTMHVQESMIEAWRKP